MSEIFAKRGVIFTLDAIIAGVLATVLLAAIVLSFNAAEAEHSPIITLRQNAEDALAAMDKQGVLQQAFTQSDADAHANLTAFLNASLPLQLGANATVEIFEYETGGSCSVGCRLDGSSPVNSFCTCKRVTNNTALPCSSQRPCAYSAQARRLFYEYSGNADRLGRATLEVWPKSN